MKDELAAAADVLVHNVEQSTRGGMKLILRLKDILDLKDFESITRYKNSHAGGIYRMILMGSEWNWSGDVMFLGWSASHTGGVKLRFQLSEESDLKFLMELSRGTDASMGMRELDDDGQMVDEERKEKIESERGGPLSKRAAQLGRDPAFRHWISERIAPGLPSITEETCASYIRTICQVPSRAKLDHDTKAAERFHNQILTPYIRTLYQES